MRSRTRSRKSQPGNVDKWNNNVEKILYLNLWLERSRGQAVMCNRNNKTFADFNHVASSGWVGPREGLRLRKRKKYRIIIYGSSGSGISWTFAQWKYYYFWLLAIDSMSCRGRVLQQKKKRKIRTMKIDGNASINKYGCKPDWVDGVDYYSARDGFDSMKRLQWGFCLCLLIMIELVLLTLIKWGLLWIILALKKSK